MLTLDSTDSIVTAFLTSITGAMSEFTTANLAEILVATLGVIVGLVICWFAYRWIVRKVSGAMKKGRL